MTFPDAEALLRRVGIRSLAADRALHMLDRVAAVPQAAIVDIDLERFQGSYEARGPRPFLDRVRTSASPSSPSGATGAAALPASGDVSPRERRRQVADSIEQAVADVLGYGAGTLDRDLGFFEMGMDSLMALDVRTQLENALGIKLSVALLFDHPTINALADFLTEQAPGVAPDALASRRSLQPPSRPRNRPRRRPRPARPARRSRSRSSA
jgi:acyl carrier protein